MFQTSNQIWILDQKFCMWNEFLGWLYKLDFTSKKILIFQPRKTCFFSLRGSNTYDENFELAILGVDMFDFAWPARYPATNINSLLVNVDNPINNGYDVIING